MLTLIGDILNQFAAGFLFPLMLLPLASMFTGRPIIGSVIWICLVLALAGAAAAFTEFAPRLEPVKAQALTGAAAAFFGATLFVGGVGPRRATERLAPLFAATARGAGRIVMWFVFLMAFTQFAVVILRYVFGVNFLALQESVTYMHGAVFLLAAGYALLTDDQVRVDIFYRDAPPKRKALVDFLGTYLFLFPVCLLILWAASSYVGQSWAVREGSAEASGVPAVFILKSFIPAFAVLMAMAGFSIAAKAGETLRGAGTGER